MESGVSADISSLLGHNIEWFSMGVTQENKNRFQSRHGIDRPGVGGGHSIYWISCDTKIHPVQNLKSPLHSQTKIKCLFCLFFFPPWCKTHIVTMHAKMFPESKIGLYNYLYYDILHSTVVDYKQVKSRR